MDLNKNIFSSESKTPTNTDHITKIYTEEEKVEKEIIKLIKSGNHESLKPNSGEPIYFGDNCVCVSFYDDPEEGCKVWEWHGHMSSYSVENGYIRDHIFGYFENVCYDGNEKEKDEREDGNDEEKEETEERS